jgi:hypothetical protein
MLLERLRSPSRYHREVRLILCALMFLSGCARYWIDDEALSQVRATPKWKRARLAVTAERVDGTSVLLYGHTIDTWSVDETRTGSQRVSAWSNAVVLGGIFLGAGAILTSAGLGPLGVDAQHGGPGGEPLVYEATTAAVGGSFLIIGAAVLGDTIRRRWQEIHRPRPEMISVGR